MTFDEVRRLVAAERAKSRCFRECDEALQDRDATFEEVGPGRMPVEEALATFSVRERTARHAEIETCGMQEALRALRSMPRGEVLMLFHFSGPDRVFTIFVASSDTRPIACIQVTRGASLEREG
jgi:hypothetical protein